MTDIHPQRISVLFPLAGPAAIDADAAIALFHRAIQQRGLPGLLLDVADYSHVPGGPGVLLIGHEVDYGIAPEGLLVVRKRANGAPLADQLRDVLRMAFSAMRFIEADGAIGVRFDAERFRLRVIDRLALANDDASADALAGAAEPLLSDLLGVRVQTVRSDATDPRRSLSLSVAARGLDRERTLAALAPAAPRSAAREAQSEWDVSVEDLRKLRDEAADFVLLDVREPSEYAHVNLGGKLIPLGELPKRLDELPKDAHVIVHCKVGGRGAKATQMLRDAGYENAWNVNGGIAAWVERIDPSLPKP